MKGCDISHHQGQLDFNVLRDNLEFVIIRATYGDGYKDTRFEINRDSARQVGLLCGFYHYAYPQYNAPEAEADWFTKTVSCKVGEIIALDFEEKYPTPVDWCKRFLDRAASNMGFKPYIYLNLATVKAYDWKPVIDAGYPLWLAHWTYDESEPVATQWGDVNLRQYSNQGNVGGITPLDLNIFYGTQAEYKATGNPAPSDTTPPPNPEEQLISPDQYFGKYDQKYLDWDKAFGFQCMDNYRFFCKEVIGSPQSPAVYGAYQVWDTYLQDYFDRIEKTPTNCPIKGDIVIWGQEIGQYGHIGICKDGDSQSFNSFDQNYPTGSPCHFQPHSYYGVLGWLRKKEPTSPEPPTPPEPPVDPCESAINSALSENNKIWQSRLATAEENLKKCQENCLNSYSWQQLFQAAYKKFFSRG